MRPGPCTEGGDLVWQRGEAPNAPSQPSFDRDEGAPRSNAPAPRRSRTAARNAQTGDRPGAGTPDRGGEATNRHLRGAAHHLELADRDSARAGHGSRKCRAPVRRGQCGDLPPGEQRSSTGRFLRGNPDDQPCPRGNSRKPRHGDRAGHMRSPDGSCP
jgi:hypothetical protein